MAANQRFHGTTQDYLKYTQAAIDRAIESGAITARDRDLLREFVNEVSANRGITPKRRYKLVYNLIGWRRFVGPFAENTLPDLQEGIQAVKVAMKPDDSPLYTQNTIADHVRFIKRFYLWLIDNGHSTIPYRKVKEIRSPPYNTMTKTVGDLFTEDEVFAMIKAAKTTKDKALIALLYEGAFRIGEIANLTWGDVRFTDWNLQVNTAEKTGMARYIPLVIARPYLAAWMDSYPKEITDTGFVFLTNIRYEPLQYQGLVKQLRIIANNAGVTKHLTPHIFRHSRVTHLLQKGVPESTIKMICWGNLNTDMLKTYAHLCNGDIDRATAELNGIVPPDEAKKSRALDPKQCPRCYWVNPPTSRTCRSCGLELSAEAVEEKKSAMEQIWSDPEFRAAFEDAVRRVQATAAH
ncbi:MAG TPA: tyrosine-type recombinase/integrase [Methanoregulaceae archaeon]|nr:tyrosine-type recombinase/integrase [Methanoregulaceae archaeon]